MYADTYAHTYVWTYVHMHVDMYMYALCNKNQTAWSFLILELEVTWTTDAIIIQVVLLSPYLCIHGISLASIHYS
jgi:hypothetical protein